MFLHFFILYYCCMCSRICVGCIYTYIMYIHTYIHMCVFLGFFDLIQYMNPSQK